MTPDQILALLKLQADLYLQVTQQQAALGAAYARIQELEATPEPDATVA